MTENTGATPVESKEGATEVESKVYTQEEVDKMLQAEADRRVNQALQKQKAEADKKLKEAQKLSQMSAEEKYRYELEQREQAIAEKERQLTLAENKNAASKVLADKGLDLSLVDLVLAEEAETMNDRINLLDKAFKKSVKAEVEKRLASKSPVSTLDANKTYTKNDLNGMSYSQAMELFKQQPDIFEN